MKSYTPIKVVLADDHDLFRDGFSGMIKKEPEIELVGEANNGEELVKIVRLLKPDIIVTDILMPVMNGIEATKVLLKAFPNIGVIALSMSNEDYLIVKMMEAGAKGYLWKNAHRDEIVQAVKTVYKGGNYYCKDTTTKVAKLLMYRSHLPTEQPGKRIFTSKEIDIIRLICNERSSQQIADELKRSVRTIDDYRKDILKKMNVKKVAGIVKYAIRHKIYIQDELGLNSEEDNK